MADGIGERSKSVVNLVIDLSIAAFIVGGIFYAASQLTGFNVSEWLAPIKTMWAPVVTIGLIGGVIYLLMAVRKTATSGE